jgi:hypothetical protein
MEQYLPPRRVNQTKTLCGCLSISALGIVLRRAKLIAATRALRKMPPVALN